MCQFINLLMSNWLIEDGTCVISSTNNQLIEDGMCDGSSMTNQLIGW